MIGYNRVEYFELQIGGFFHGFTRVHLEKTKDEYTLGYYPGFDNPEDAKKVQITEHAFQNTLSKINDCNLMEWEEEYVDLDIDDGTQWTIRLKLENEEEREWYGCNLYPQKEDWNQFIAVMNELPIPPLNHNI